MRKPLIAGAFLAASLFAAGSASAAELLIVSLLPGQSLWYVNGKLSATVDPDAFGTMAFSGGAVTIQVLDENADGQTRQVTFDAAQLAARDGRSFWCVGGKLDDATQKPKIVVMPKPNCQKFIDTSL